MKYSFQTIAIILFLFVVTQLVGLAVNSYYFKTELPYGLKPPDIEKEESPLFFIGAIFVVTLVFFVMHRLRFEILLKIWFFLAFVIGISITLNTFLESMFAVIAAIVLTLIRFNERDLVLHNMTEILLYGGIVAIFIPVLNLTTIMIILIIIAVYDFIAVFITKHMVDLAKTQEKLGIFSGLIVVNNDEVAILGGGDIAFTMLLTSVLLRDFGSVPSFFALYGAIIGLFVLIMIGEKKKFYPAMPFIVAGSLIGLGISLLL